MGASHKRVCKIDQAFFSLVLGMLMVLTSSHAKEFKQDVQKRFESLLHETKGKENYDKEFKQMIDLGEGVVPMAIEHFQKSSAPWQERWICSMVLGHFSNQESKKALKKSLHDPLFLIRLASLKSVAQLDDPKVLGWIENALDDKAMVVRSEAVTLLGQKGSQESIQKLERALFDSKNMHKNKSLWIRENIIEVFGQLKSPKAIDPLKKVLVEKETHIKKLACEALEKIEPTVKLKNKEPCWIEWEKHLEKKV